MEQLLQTCKIRFLWKTFFTLNTFAAFLQQFANLQGKTSDYLDFEVPFLKEVAT